MTQTEIPNPVAASPIKLVGLSLVTAVPAASLVAWLGCLATGTTGLEMTQTTAMAGATAAFFVTIAAAATVMLLSMLRVPGGLLVLFGSMARTVILIVSGVAVQYAVNPKPGAFWAGLVAAWLVAKAVEVRLLWPSLTGVAKGSTGAAAKS